MTTVRPIPIMSARTTKPIRTGAAPVGKRSASRAPVRERIEVRNNGAERPAACLTASLALWADAACCALLTALGPGRAEPTRDPTGPVCPRAFRERLGSPVSALPRQQRGDRHGCGFSAAEGGHCVDTAQG